LDELKKWLSSDLDTENVEKEYELFTQDSRISAAIDRRTGAATPYTRSSITVNSGVEGYFLADVPEGENEKLDGILNLLEHRGIGGERSSGFGQISFEKRKHIPEFLQNRKGEKYYTLSLYNPTEEEINKIGSSCAYKLEKRSYWFKEGVLTDRYTFFKEGSLFDFKPSGKDIFFNHPSKKLIKGNPFCLGVNV
jgi:CRISPR type III-A-associated RAMP protein Csm4